MEPAYRYRAAAARIIDGDTYHLAIDLGFHVGITVPVRLRGVDTPELDTPEGKLARDFARDLLLPPPPLPPTPLIVQSYRDRQSFARWVCDVWLPGPDAPPLAWTIINAGHGRPIDPR